MCWVIFCGRARVLDMVLYVIRDRCYLYKLRHWRWLWPHYSICNATHVEWRGINAEWEHSDRTDLRQGESRYGSGLLIRTSDPDDFQNLTGTSLFKETLVIKFSWRSDQFIQRYEPNSWNMPYLAVLKNPSQNSWIRIRKRKTSETQSVLPGPLMW